jgi:hypothetical protein
MSKLKQRKNVTTFEPEEEETEAKLIMRQQTQDSLKEAEEDDDKKRSNLTLMEECLLLALKDNQVRFSETLIKGNDFILER